MTPGFVVLSLAAPGRAAGMGRAEVSDSGYMGWVGLVGSAQRVRDGDAVVQRDLGDRTERDRRGPRELGPFGRCQSITARRDRSWGWGPCRRRGASRPPRWRGRAGDLAGARPPAPRGRGPLCPLLSLEAGHLGRAVTRKRSPRPLPSAALPPAASPLVLISLRDSVGHHLSSCVVPLPRGFRRSRPGLEARLLRGRLGRFHNVPSSRFVLTRPAERALGPSARHG